MARQVTWRGWARRRRGDQTAGGAIVVGLSLAGDRPTAELLRTGHAPGGMRRVRDEEPTPSSLPTERQFRGVGQPVASGPSFDTAEDISAFLDQIAVLPVWRLDLDDDSIEFDNTDLSITDKSTGGNFSLRGWSIGVAGRGPRPRSGSRPAQRRATPAARTPA